VTSLGRLSLEAGIRADFPQEQGAEWSPRFGARYVLGGSTSLRGTVSRAFKLPSFFALASPAQLGGNPELRPETSVGVDIGLDQKFADGALAVGLTAFWIRYEDLIDFDFERFQNVNRDEVKSRGAELSVRWDPEERVTVLADVTYQDAQSPDTDQPLRNLPKWSGSVRLAYSWELAPAWEILARVDNLTDADVQHFIGFPQPGTSARIGLRHGIGPKASTR
jgi:vitamin B12 transporter